MKVLRLRSWNFHAPNLDAMTRFYQLALGAELGAQPTLARVKVNRYAPAKPVSACSMLRKGNLPACPITRSTLGSISAQIADRRGDRRSPEFRRRDIHPAATFAASQRAVRSSLASP